MDKSRRLQEALLRRMAPLSLRSRALAFWQFALQSHSGYFGTLLNLHPTELGGSLEIRETRPELSRVAVRIPRWCCDPQDGGRVRLSALVAMLDEVSTYCGTCLWDRSMRPGVSIQLSARAVRRLDLGEGDAAVFETRLQKIGRTVGFVGISVTTEAGLELVQARHIKFMPMGPIFDLLLHPSLQPYSVPLWRRLILDRRRLHQVPSFPERIEQLFQLQASSSPTHSSLLLERQHGNPLGSIHGGCGVMATTHAAATALQDVGGSAKRPLLIQTNLLAGAPTTKNCRVELATDIFPGEQLHSRTLLSSAEGPAIETEVWWAS